MATFKNNMLWHLYYPLVMSTVSTIIILSLSRLMELGMSPYIIKAIKSVFNELQLSV